MSNQEQSTTTVPITAHLFPFTSPLEGPVNSKDFFQFAPTTSIAHQHNSIATYETIVMGRRLIGYGVDLPESCKGHIWQHVQTPENRDEHEEEEEEEQKPRLIKKSEQPVSRFVLWKKDTAPNDQDARLKMIEDWHTVMDAVHEPIPL
ncbi:ribonuclease H2, subunit C [Zychaea mexicana]|uniref:ribonuclease H2, subunit C n=1 Tax=Zychaea mexicana TaxID=64656 RepID=UPI0022FE7E42|nr:ribonuclease H2, subunit C [Zychaea mexicana]KAI9494885.1 ribonuclease H2, subunit C [Zychaea mexicana]